MASNIVHHRNRLNPANPTRDDSRHSRQPPPHSPSSTVRSRHLPNPLRPGCSEGRLLRPRARFRRPGRSTSPGPAAFPCSAPLGSVPCFRQRHPGATKSLLRDGLRDWFRPTRASALFHASYINRHTGACVSYSLTMATPSTNRCGSIHEENPRPTDDPVPRPLGPRTPRIPRRCPMSTDGVQHGLGIGLDRPATNALECCAAWAWPTPEGRRRSPAGSGSLYRPATLGSLRPPHGGCRHQAGRNRRQRSGILKGPLGEPLVHHRARQFQQVDREIRPTHRKVSYPLRACFRPSESRAGTDQPYVDASG